MNRPSQAPGKEARFDVFISHASEDRPVANSVCATLEQAGIRCWIAPRDIEPGSTWADAIVESIDQCQLVVLIFSHSANESKYVNREIHRAFSTGKVIIPFRLEKTATTGSMAFFADAVHWLDAFPPPLEQHLARLAAQVTSNLERTPPPPDNPPPEIPSRPVRVGRSTPGLAFAALGLAVVGLVAAAGWHVFRDGDSAEPAIFSPEPVKSTPAVPAETTNGSVRPPAAIPVPVSSNQGPPYSPESPFLNSLGMRFVSIPGTTTLFSVWETRNRDYEAYVRETGDDNGTWNRVDRFEEKADHPVVQVSALDAEAFCAWLNRRESLPEGWSYRLPTDYEWSLAIGIGDRESVSASPEKKSGVDFGYPWGKEWPPPPGSVNYAVTPDTDTAKVGSFSLDHHGLKDLSGNAYEWCATDYDETNRIIRGGSFQHNRETGNNFASSDRSRLQPGRRMPYTGFRVVIQTSP